MGGSSLSDLFVVCTWSLWIRRNWCPKVEKGFHLFLCQTAKIKKKIAEVKFCEIDF